MLVWFVSKSKRLVKSSTTATNILKEVVADSTSVQPTDVACANVCAVDVVHMGTQQNPS